MHPIKVDKTSHSGSSRVAYIDLLRIIACFLVIVNHTSALFGDRAPSFTWFVSLTYFFTSKIAVPLFLMISGYTMLDRQYSHREAFLRFVRYGCTLVLFSGIYYISYYLDGDIDAISIKGFIAWIIQWPITNAYWYLYLYLGIILMLPFLQKLIFTFEKKDFLIYFFYSGLFFSLWPIVVHYIPALDYTDYFSLPLFNSYLCILFLGFFIKKYSSPSAKWRNISLVGFSAGIIINVLLTYSEYIRNSGSHYLFFDDRVFLPIVFSSFCFFYAVSNISLSESTQKLIRIFSRLTFGIYLISDLLIEKLKFVNLSLLAIGIHPLAAMFLFELAVFFSAGVITWILKKYRLSNHFFNPHHINGICQILLLTYAIYVFIITV